jgi:hypothetical protein
MLILCDVSSPRETGKSRIFKELKRDSHDILDFQYPGIPCRTAYDFLYTFFLRKP